MGQKKSSDPILLPRNEMKALNILESTIKKLCRHYALVGLLWKEEFQSLPNKRNLGLPGIMSLDWKIKRSPEFRLKYQ